ncbi:MAG: hypothetical protein KDC85_18155 [Saprospiraceae bacterium]|nr:hypothetical protein [Saprospiraceae bacterium]MCB9326497.1 hypothetical protein [Lewinellaceae bacterium]
MMDNQRALLLKLEFFWWFIAALMAAVLVLPIYLQLPDFPHIGLNVLLVFCFIFFTRHIFFLRFTFIAKRQYLKVALFFIMIPVVFLLIQKLNFLQGYINEGILFNDLEKLPYKEQLKLEKYIRHEILLVGTAAIVSAILFAIRMLISVWKYRNRGTV